MLIYKKGRNGKSKEMVPGKEWLKRNKIEEVRLEYRCVKGRQGEKKLGQY